MIPNVWGGGQLLAYSGIEGKTDFKNGLTLQTAIPKPETPYAIWLRLPAQGRIVWNGKKKPSKIEITGDYFCLNDSRGVFLDAWHFLLEGDFTTELDSGYEEERQGKRILIAPKGFIRSELLNVDIESTISQRLEFLKSVPVPKGVTELRQAAYAKAVSQIKSQIYTPEGIINSRWSTPDRWPHRKMWLWDTVFHVIGMKNINLPLAREILGAMFDVQQSDGRIPHSADPYNIPDRTQPPVLGLGIEALEAQESNPQWLKPLIPKLANYLEWIMANRNYAGDGLLEWAVDEESYCRSGESGMDNSPRFDESAHLEATDFNSFFASECEVMARLQPEKAAYWSGHHQRICELINERLWNEELGFYMDYDLTAGKQSNILASSGFLPLFCGAATPERAAKLRDHLYNPETFGTKVRIPSIAKSNANAYSKDMWRGPMWTNINYIIALGLKRYGYHAEAEEIIGDTLEIQEKYYHEHGTFFEFYDDRDEVPPPELLRKPLISKGDEVFGQPLRDYGWSATLYIEFVNWLRKLKADLK